MTSGSFSVKLMANNVLLTLVLILLGVSTAIGLNDCPKDTRNDSIIRIGFLSRYKSSKVILGALPLVVDFVNAQEDLLPGKTLEYYAVNIGTDAAISSNTIKNMTDLMIKEDVVAFIGPDESCLYEALVASAWNLPMISYSCADVKVTDKTLFPTFARTSLGPPEKISKSVVALLKAYLWSKFIIVSDTRQWNKEITLAIKDLAGKNRLNVTDVKYFTDYIRAKYEDMQTIVDESFRRTRIYVFVGGPWALDDFMLCLQERNLLESGEYMVISVNDEFYNPDLRTVHDSRQNNIMSHPFLSRFKNKALKMRSYQSILQITLTAPSVNLTTFYRDIREKAKEKFNIPFHSKIAPVISVRAAYLYDAVLIYAQAATKVLEHGGDLRDGRSLMQKYVFNNIHTSKQGFQVLIDENGNAEGNFSVFSMQPVNESTMTMQQVGSFVSLSNDDVLPQFQLSESRNILWLNGVPPKDEPKCGFEGCPDDWGFIISSVFVFLFVALVSAFLIKHYRYEQKLQSIMWKVDLREITFLGSEYNEEAYRTGNLTQYFRQRTMSLVGGDASRRAYTTIAFYRGNFVALKKVHKRSIDLTRSIKKELKLMRELRHENIATFVGASTDHSNIYILTNYCARGSLENVLANQDLKLDNMFVSSLVFDIMKGLIFLHDSEIVSHGNLRSSNCLVDQRWCVKLTDFGLNEFKSSTEEPDKDEKEMKRSLSRAPELLRLQNPPSNGTQKGDVYSFAVLLYEIYGRKGPFGIGSIDPGAYISTIKEVIDKLRNPPNQKVALRPPLHVIDAPECVKQSIVLCWNEDPEDRPDMRLVRIKLKELQGGLKSNIFDNMMSLMEKYAYNLEELVQQRTNQLSEEKKKTENLLLRMLPRSVAESLMQGERVVAEGFDCVTIMFSDLVGFTEICSKSTPLEVVEMLNDLYSLMDSIISNFDCYKVETIGDAMMVVSGLPIRNSDHASQIASLALMVMNRASQLEIRHRPGELFQLRIGIHSGQVVAGCVGDKMPRYCLFGDTVNCASRMESTSETRRIHISLATYTLLKKSGCFVCEERGLTFIKGKGEMRTFWLKSEDKNKSSSKSKQTEWSRTPDLLQMNDRLKIYSDFSTKSLNHVNNCYLFNALTNQTFEEYKPTLNGSKKFPSHDCYMCQKKKYLFQKYHHELRHRCERFNWQINYTSDLSFSTDSGSGQNVCSCNKKSRNESVPSRSPSSAPQIIFKE